MRIGYFLSCEEHPPEELVRQARLAAAAGFEGLWISDHYHPWNHEQGQSPFVWSVIGAVSQVCDLPITTAVTCPTVRIHPAVIAQAAATSARMCRGGFRLGVGSGEALNEHVTGSRWPTADVRLEMLEEAVDVIRRLLTGERVTHHGRHYTVEDARIFTLPEEESVASYRDQGGRGPAMAGAKACWGPDRAQAQELAHRLWANAGVPGELAQVLPRPGSTSCTWRRSGPTRTTSSGPTRPRSSRSCGARRRRRAAAGSRSCATSAGGLAPAWAAGARGR